MGIMENMLSFMYSSVLKYLPGITTYLGEHVSGNKCFLERTSEDPDVGHPWAPLSESELDGHSSVRNKPESIPYFATGFLFLL